MGTPMQTQQHQQQQQEEEEEEFAAAGVCAETYSERQMMRDMADT